MARRKVKSGNKAKKGKKSFGKSPVKPTAPGYTTKPGAKHY